MLQISNFTENHEVVTELRKLRQFFNENGTRKFEVSDIVDDEGHQYIDLVQEGGGVLGIALLGYTYVLEQMNVRFLNLAGTSAGAINTAMLASLGKPNEAKSLKILDLLVNTDLNTFVDGGNDALSLVNAIQKGGAFSLGFSVLRNLDDLLRGDLGINRGEVFYNWVKSTMEKNGVFSTADLLKKMNDLPKSLGIRKSINVDRTLIDEEAFKVKIAIVATDLTTETKVDFPRMSELYWQQPDTVHPADYVRASMSIPLFFDPYIVDGIPQGMEMMDKWADPAFAFYNGPLPKKVHFVDGGVMSNFPIDIFHVNNRMPLRPTFGVKLGMYRNSFQKVESLIDVLWKSFSAASQIRDHDVIVKNPDFIRLVASIDDEGMDWLNFQLPDEDKIELFVRGVKTGVRFLKEFDWNDYKKMRHQMLEQEPTLFKSTQIRMAKTFSYKE